MTKVVEFKNKKQMFNKWLQDVVRENFDNDIDVKSAIILWEVEDKDGFSTANHSKYNCDLKNKEWFCKCLSNDVQQSKFHEFLKENIKDYLEYIE